jgi:hypothetical protein
MSLDIGRLIWSARDEEGQARLSLQWVRDADRVSHLDTLQDWVADLSTKYEALLYDLPNWHAMKFSDRPAVDKARDAYLARIRELDD